MAKTEPFEKYTQEYDEWFIKNKNQYLSELNSIKNLIPKSKKGIEIGVGSGRFASPLGIKYGVDPSIEMTKLSRKRGIQVSMAVAEQLPFKNNTFDYVLQVTTICFLDDIFRSFQEAYRILKKDGIIIVGFIEKNSKLGLQYNSKKDKSRFYKDATFYSTNEVLSFLRKSYFKDILTKQIILNNENDKLSEYENNPSKGSFIVIKAMKEKTYRGRET